MYIFFILMSNKDGIFLETIPIQVWRQTPAKRGDSSTCNITLVSFIYANWGCIWCIGSQPLLINWKQTEAAAGTLSQWGASKPSIARKVPKRAFQAKPCLLSGRSKVMQSFIVSLIFISLKIGTDNLAWRWIIPHGQTLETAVSLQLENKGLGLRPQWTAITPVCL